MQARSKSQHHCNAEAMPLITPRRLKTLSTSPRSPYEKSNAVRISHHGNSFSAVAICPSEETGKLQPLSTAMGRKILRMSTSRVYAHYEQLSTSPGRKTERDFTSFENLSQVNNSQGEDFCDNFRCPEIVKFFASDDETRDGGAKQQKNTRDAHSEGLKPIQNDMNCGHSGRLLGYDSETKAESGAKTVSSRTEHDVTARKDNIFSSSINKRKIHVFDRHTTTSNAYGKNKMNQRIQSKTEIRQVVADLNRARLKREEQTRTNALAKHFLVVRARGHMLKESRIAKVTMVHEKVTEKEEVAKLQVRNRLRFRSEIVRLRSRGVRLKVRMPRWKKSSPVQNKVILTKIYKKALSRREKSDRAKNIRLKKWAHETVCQIQDSAIKQASLFKKTSTDSGCSTKTCTVPNVSSADSAQSFLPQPASERCVYRLEQTSNVEAVTAVHMDCEIMGSVKAGGYQYYRFGAVPRGERISISLHTTDSLPPRIYMGNKSCPRPTNDQFIWRSSGVTKSENDFEVNLTVPPFDTLRIAGSHFVAIFGVGDCHYRFKVSPSSLSPQKDHSINGKKSVFLDNSGSTLVKTGHPECEHMYVQTAGSRVKHAPELLQIPVPVTRDVAPRLHIPDQSWKPKNMKWQSLASWLTNLGINASSVALVQEERVSGAQLAAMTFEELMSDLNVSESEAGKILAQIHEADQGADDSAK